MRVFCGVILITAAIWIAVGRADIALGAWGTVFAHSVLLPRGWLGSSVSWMNGVAGLAIFYLATLIALWTANQPAAAVLAAATGIGLVATG